MPDTDETVWSAPAHTLAKHTILSGYLGAWFAKLGQTHPRIVYVDGFAGPGEYSDGAPGSPLIALDLALGHRADLSKCEIVMLFIESREDRFESLQERIATRSLPENIKARVVHSVFEDAFTGVLDSVEEAGGRLAPAFVMIDPFGWTGYPFELIKRLARHPRSEVLVTFMYEAINRWVMHPHQQSNMSVLFGTESWREIDQQRSPADRRDFLVGLYVEQLRDAGFTYPYTFEMRDSGNRTEYFLIHGTKSLVGLAAMKRAMWATDPSGDFAFSDWVAERENLQPTLMTGEPDFHDVQARIREWLAGRDWTEVNGALLEFILVETPYHDGHFRRPALVPMQREEVIETRRPNGRSRGYWREGTYVRLA